MVEISFLGKFGMTKTEAKLYLSIARLGETMIGPIVKSTGLHRGTVYNSINDLVEKGFVSFIDKGGLRYYKATGQKIFNSILSERIHENDKQKIELGDFFEDLAKYEKKPVDNEVAVFYGKDALKTALISMINHCEKHNCEFIFLGDGREINDNLGEGFFLYLQRLKKKKGVKARVLLDMIHREHQHHKQLVGLVGYLSNKVYTPVNFWIYEDRVLLVLFKANPLTIIKIRSENLADSFRNYFECLWDVSEKREAAPKNKKPK
jgi:sugar-specific transcriptional regulator TrmB